MAEFYTACVCYLLFFSGYHETFIPTKPGRDIYKGQDLFQIFLVVDRMTL